MKNNKKTILITGCNGFIGYHVANKLLDNNFRLIGIDNNNSYYDPNLKKKRFNLLKKRKNFFFSKIDIKNKKKLFKIIKKFQPFLIINLAAQAGVRYSFENPQKYIDSNITGFVNLMEIMKTLKIKRLIYASSSSVYGDCKDFPFKENMKLSPLNFYGQTKLLNERISDVYRKNFKIDSIGLRLFTVYGPYGRPDMYIPKILDKIKKGNIIEVYNNGKNLRDFTYVGDVSDIIKNLVVNFNKVKKFNILNICNGKEINILKLLKMCEKKIGLRAKILLKPMQRGDMFKTHGNNSLIKKLFKAFKFTKFEEGLSRTIKKDYFKY